MGFPRWIPTAIWFVAGAFSLGILGAAQSLVSSARSEALEQGSVQTKRVLGSAEAALNRTLLSVDVMLAGVADLLRPAQLAQGGVDAEQAQAMLMGLVKRNLLVRDLALLDAQGRLLARAQPQLPAGFAAAGGVRPWPEGFVREAMGQASATLAISPVGRSAVTMEPVVHLARPMVFLNGQRVLVVAEVPLQLISGSLVPEAALEGMQITLEREDGQLLGSVPPSGAERLSPPLDPRAADGVVKRGRSRIDGREALVGTRSSLYRTVLLSVSMPIDETLLHWRAERGKIFATAAVFLALLLLAAALVHWHWARLSRARQEIASSKALLDQALASMSDGFLLCDPKDRVLAWNARYVATFPWLKGLIRRGIAYEALVRYSVSKYFPQATEEEANAWVERRMAAHLSEHGEFEQDIGNGLVVQAIETRLPDGGVVSVFRDITASERELSRAKAAAEAANASKTQFLAAMSHEIRTPLNAVLGMNGLLLNTPLSDQQKRYVELIRSSGQMLLSVINDVLDISKIEAARMELEIAEFSPAGILDEVVSLLSVRAEAKGLALRTRLAPGLPGALRGDASRIRQVLFNLIGNALKFTEQGHVEVDVRHEPLPDGRVNFCVAIIDTGIGIAPESLPTLFDRFTQADSSTARRYGGSGLGLAISSELVTLMGGTLTVRSALGEGSTFEMKVPLARGDNRLLARQQEIGADIPQPAPASLRILVAEDNGVNQILIKAVLDQMGHYCDIVADGIEAVRQVQQAQYDLVLMDIQMPEMDGQAATQAIRALDGPVSRIPIIAMTANAMVEDRDAYLGVGMNDYVSKPIVVRQLALAIARVASGAAAQRQPGKSVDKDKAP